jgi:hypothetical protein
MYCTTLGPNFLHPTADGPGESTKLVANLLATPWKLALNDGFVGCGWDDWTMDFKKERIGAPLP